jgi:hypothetical protein
VDRRLGYDHGAGFPRQPGGEPADLRGALERSGQLQATSRPQHRRARGSERAGRTAGGRPAREARVLRYAGPPLDEVGVGETGMNASRGDCMVAHPSNVLFLYTKAAWHQVG